MRDRLARASPVAARPRIARRLIAAGLAAAAAAAGIVVAVLLLRAPAPPPQPGHPHTAPPSRPHPPRLLVGVADDTLKWTPDPLAVVRRQRALGAQAVRIWVPWQGEAQPVGPRLDELGRAEEAARVTHVVLAISGLARDTPTTAAAQARFCGYAQAALARVPDAYAVVVWNEGNDPTFWSGSPAQYESLLARCYDALHRPGLTVLDSTASGHAPEAFLRAMGDAYRQSGRNLPLVDAFGHDPYPASPAEPPTAVHAVGFVGEGDYARLAAVLREAFGRPADVWYLEDGYQSQVPARLLAGYGGHETVGALTPELQARRLAEAIRLASCQPRVRAFFNFELVDETRLTGWQSGLIWRGVHRKPAARAFAAAARRAAAGCVGRP